MLLLVRCAHYQLYIAFPKPQYDQVAVQFDSYYVCLVTWSCHSSTVRTVNVSCLLCIEGVVSSHLFLGLRVQSPSPLCPLVRVVLHPCWAKCDGSHVTSYRCRVQFYDGFWLDKFITLPFFRNVSWWLQGIYHLKVYLTVLSTFVWKQINLNQNRIHASFSFRTAIENIRPHSVFYKSFRQTLAV